MAILIQNPPFNKTNTAWVRQLYTQDRASPVQVNQNKLEELVSLTISSLFVGVFCTSNQPNHTLLNVCVVIVRLKRYQGSASDLTTLVRSRPVRLLKAYSQGSELYSVAVDQSDEEEQ